jgi:hypothetical protein
MRLRNKGVENGQASPRPRRPAFVDTQPVMIRQIDHKAVLDVAEG